MHNIIDAHSHLWLKQDTVVDGQRIRTLSPNGSRSAFFGEEVQMLPPFMIDGRNTAEVFLSNMDYAQVGGAVVVQEVIDGNQNEYISEVQKLYPTRFFGIFSMMPMFKYMETQQLTLSMCLADNEQQIGEMGEIIRECPRLKIAIGHFGMPTTPSFRQQVMLARLSDNVRIESGGITWLYHPEFYPFPTAVRRIRQAADWVGWDKLMWGSDYPRTITAITYKMSYDFITRSTEISETEKEAFLGKNAHDFYGFGKLPDLPYIKNMSE